MTKQKMGSRADAAGARYELTKSVDIKKNIHCQILGSYLIDTPKFGRIINCHF